VGSRRPRPRARGDLRRECGRRCAYPGWISPSRMIASSTASISLIGLPDRRIHPSARGSSVAAGARSTMCRGRRQRDASDVRGRSSPDPRGFKSFKSSERDGDERGWHRASRGKHEGSRMCANGSRCPLPMGARSRASRFRRALREHALPVRQETLTTRECPTKGGRTLRGHRVRCRSPAQHSE